MGDGNGADRPHASESILEGSTWVGTVGRRRWGIWTDKNIPKSCHLQRLSGRSFGMAGFSSSEQNAHQASSSTRPSEDVLMVGCGPSSNSGRFAEYRSANHLDRRSRYQASTSRGCRAQGLTMINGFQLCRHFTIFRRRSHAPQPQNCSMTPTYCLNERRTDMLDDRPLAGTDTSLPQA